MATEIYWLVVVDCWVFAVVERTTLLEEPLSQKVIFTDTLQCLEQSWTMIVS